LARESKVLRNIESHGNLNLEGLLPHVYSDVPEQLFPIAKMSLLAHLIKLVEDKKVVCVDDVYSLT